MKINHHGASLSIAVHIVTTIGTETGSFLYSNATYTPRTRRTPTRTRTINSMYSTVLHATLKNWEEPGDEATVHIVSSPDPTLLRGKGSGVYRALSCPDFSV